MEIPTRCFECPMCCVDTCGILCCVDSCCISHGSYIEYREVDVDTAKNGRPDWCPLIPAPPHGRLIDADALMENAQYKGTHDIVTAWDIVAAPTIIPADGKDTNVPTKTEEEGE